MRKSQIEELKKFAEKKKGVCDSIEYKGVLAKYTWRCKKGHSWEESWNAIKKERSWCPMCASRTKYTIDDLNKYAKSKWGKCVSTEYINNYTKYKWQCKKNHVWFACWHQVKKAKTWCRICSQTKYTIKDLREYAKSKNAECLSTEYINTHTKYKWQCKKGHVWESSWGRVYKNGDWCAICAGTAKYTIDQLKEYAEKKDGKCLSIEYINNKTKYKWQCQKGHIWHTKWEVIKNTKCWCPVCAIENRKLKHKKRK